MRIIFKPVLFALALLLCMNLAAQNNDGVSYNPNRVVDTARRSIKSMAFAKLGDDSIKISYHSPGVRNRVIWGGLVPYNKVWVTGAHDATALEMPRAFVVNGQEIPAGKYALFTIPGETEWILIINKNWKQHLANKYDEKEDVIRLHIKPQANDHTERLQYFIETQPDHTGTISMAWEKLKIQFPFVLKN